MYVVLSDEATILTKYFIGDNLIKVNQLEELLGNAYNPTIGIYNGLYNSNSSNHFFDCN
jgi:hypothetical protein